MSDKECIVLLLSAISADESMYMGMSMLFILVGLSFFSTIINMISRQYNESWRKMQELKTSIQVSKLHILRSHQLHFMIQGDTSRCAKPPVDLKKSSGHMFLSQQEVLHNVMCHPVQC